jgi:AraC-like DNA-binding protein
VDPLDQIVALLRPKALLWKQMEANGDWTVRYPASRGIVFCFVVAGRCRLDVAGQASRWVEAGEFILLVAPPRWTLGTGSKVRPVDYLPEHDQSKRLVRFLGDSKRPADAKIVGGRFAFDATNIDLLKGLVPPRVEVSATDPAATRLRHVLSLIRDETSSDRPGQGLVVGRLLEVLLVEAIRQKPASDAEGQPGLLAGLADIQVGKALRALHANVRKTWTVEQVATMVGMSRSAFAERFVGVVGLPPMDYLLQLRMALAKDALRFGGGRLSEIASACGYRSVSSFSTAFRRIVGCPPGKYAARPS